MSCNKATQCCCSVCAGPAGCCEPCCGPPIWMAARGVAIFQIILSVLGLASAIFAGFVSTECNQNSAPAMNYIMLILSVIGLGLYSFAIFAAQSMQTQNAQILLFAHIAFQFIYVLAGGCSQGGLSKSRREKEPAFDAICVDKCISEGTGGWNGCLGPNPSWGAAIGSMIIMLLIEAYFTYIFWSFYARCADGTVTQGVGGVIVVIANNQMASSVAQPVGNDGPIAIASAVAVPMAVSADSKPTDENGAPDSQQNMYPVI
mmetsp:Transcript_58422/g.138976  ORF Transcript_58422/g.138976 Transcript_58422/m.138976 type:complete len:260 (-) Transcript_58422:66-845(-)